MRYLGAETHEFPNMKFIYVSCILYAYILKAIYTVFLMHLCFGCDKVGYGMEYSVCDVMSALRKVWVLEHFGFGAFRLEVLRVYREHAATGGHLL